MTLCCEVHDRARVVITQQSFNQRRVTNIAMYELHTRRVAAVEIGAITRVGQCVKHDEFLIRVLRQTMTHKISANKACAASHEKC